MMIRFQDTVDCSIEFESTDLVEKKLLRDIYFKFIGLSKSEQFALLENLRKEGYQKRS